MLTESAPSYELCRTWTQSFELGSPSVAFPAVSGSVIDWERDDSDTSDDEDCDDTTYLLREPDEPDMTACSPSDVGGVLLSDEKAAAI